MKIFVYGTLKYGYGNWSYYLDDEHVEFLGDASVDGFGLKDSGFPVAYELTDGRVEGHLFEFDETTPEGKNTLNGLDRLEGVPRMYQRREVEVIPSDGVPIMANMYVGSPTCWNFTTMKDCEVVVENDVKIHSWDR